MTQGKYPEVRLLALAALAGQLGFAIALPMVGGVWLGSYLDSRMGTGAVFVLIGIFLGLGLGVAGAYRIISREVKWKQ